jgi:hypothetical protein
MSLPVVNLQSALVNAKGIILEPWIQFFQQFVQKPTAASAQSVNASYTAKEPGSLSVVGGTALQITRGSTTVAVTGNFIPVEIGDVVSWTGGATVVFFPRY